MRYFLLLLVLALPAYAAPSLDKDSPLRVNEFELGMSLDELEKAVGKPLQEGKVGNAYRPGLVAGKKDGKVRNLTVLGGGDTFRLKQDDSELIKLGMSMVAAHQILGLPDERYEQKEHFKAYFHVYRLAEFDLGVQFVDGKVESFEIHRAGQIDEYIEGTYEKL